LGTWALAVFALAFVFGSTGFMGAILYAALRQNVGGEFSAWELAVAGAVSGFLGLMMVWVLLKLISPPD
jgi:hypothetical protein